MFNFDLFQKGVIKMSVGDGIFYESYPLSDIFPIAWVSHETKSIYSILQKPQISKTTPAF